MRRLPEEARPELASMCRRESRPDARRGYASSKAGESSPSISTRFRSCMSHYDMSGH